MTTKIETTENTNEEIKAEVVTPIANEDAEAIMNKLKAENDGLKASLRMRNARDEITTSLRTAGARSPELMFEAVSASLQFGDDGELKNAAAIVGDMKRKFPEQFGSEPALPATIDGGAGTHTTPNTLTKEALAKMKPADIAKLDWAEVRNVLSER